MKERIRGINQSYLLSRAVVAALFLFAVFTGNLRAEDHLLPAPPQIGECRGEDTCGGGQPDPLALYNLYVELAHGELYLLKGNLVYGGPVSDPKSSVPLFFQVDLRVHPWLAGKARSADPIYPIEGELQHWDPYQGTYGELAAMAQVRVEVDAHGMGTHKIVLKPISELSRF